MTMQKRAVRETILKACQADLTTDEIDYIVSELEECRRKSKVLGEKQKGLSFTLSFRGCLYSSFLEGRFATTATFNAERLSIVDSSHFLLPT